MKKLLLVGLVVLFSATAQAGERFVKLDRAGHTLADDAQIWACVHDKKNNLIWEAKLASKRLNSHQKYSWKKAQKLKKTAKKENLCGFKKWALPSIEELKTLVDTTHKGNINSSYFPHNQMHYWSASPYNKGSDKAWFLFFEGAASSVGNVKSQYHARLVHYPE